MTKLPSGTVVFLFTDIEGSASQWEAHPDQMQQALRLHDALLSQAIEANGGYIYRTVGDAYSAAFEAAPQALRAALHAQRALHAAFQVPSSKFQVGESESADAGAETSGFEPGTWNLELKVRMALHTGVTEERDGDYVGPALNRVARLLSAAHGGQVLLSLATQELLKGQPGQMPDGVTLRDLGEHRLKDLIWPERIFQLVAPDLPSDFPPLRTLDNRPNNLPLQPTPFIGREKVLQAVHDMLLTEDVRLLTLTGPGGIGKTRLAVQVAAELLDEFEDGVFFVPLASISDPALVVQAIAQALSVREAGGQPLLETLKEHLRDKEMLLVLDNFEQVTDAAPQVAELVMSAPRLKALVTSRAALHLYVAHEYPVPSLSVPDPGHLPAGEDLSEQLSQYEAVELFIARARAANPRFEVNNANAPAVAEICVRLDGLPLAIELAAARARVLSPQAMLSRLGNRMSLLTGGARDLPARQQTLRATIEWSHDLLHAEEQKLFRRLAVFVGGHTLEAAEAIASQGVGGQSLPPNPQPLTPLDLDILDGTASLVDKSLLRQREDESAEPRFFMLETIREYALERLQESGEADDLRRQHAYFYLDFAEQAEAQIMGHQQATWLQRLQDEHDNLRAALQWSLDQGDEKGSDMALRISGALWRFWYMHGHLSEGRNWLDAALDQDAATSAAARAKALNGAGNLTYQLADYATARARHQEALALRRELGDKPGIAASLGNLGNLTADEGDTLAARPLYEESLAILREIGDKRSLASALHNLGVISWELGDYAAACSFYDECLALERKAGNKWGMALTLSNLGHLASTQGDFDAARAYQEEALTIHRELGDRPSVAACLTNLGSVAHAVMQYDKARSLYEESLALKRDIGDKKGIGSALGSLGELSHDLGDYVSARALHEQSLEVKREIGDKQGIAASFSNLGHVAYAEGDYEGAQSLHRESLALLRESGYKIGIAWCLEGLAGAAGALGGPHKAAVLFGAEEALRETLGAPRRPSEQPRYDRYLANTRAQMGDESWQAAWAEGRAMLLADGGLERAVAYALDEVPSQV